MEATPLGATRALPPRAGLLSLIMGKVVAHAVYALAELGVADHLTSGPRTLADLAQLSGADPDALYRLLRCTAAFDVFEELPDRRFASTPMSDCLRRDSPSGVRNLVLMNGHSSVSRSYAEITHSARTGRTAFDHVFGMSFFSYLDQHPEHAAAFHGAMTEANARSAELLGRSVRLSSFSRLADVGGGQGSFLAELLDRNPGLTGVLVDRPAVTAAAAALLAERGFADRTEVVAGDFFVSVPADCDAYVLKLVLHDWTDEEAVRILRTVRTAVGDRSARVFVIERLLGSPNSADLAKVLDVDMLVVFGGRERMLDDWRRLGEAAGFDLAVEPIRAEWAVLHFKPR